MSAIRARFWRLFYSRWRGSVPAREPGYTNLVPVPGDLPVFLELALAVCGKLDRRHRVETLVVPDRMTPACQAVVERVGPGWAGGPLRMIGLRRLDRLVTRFNNNPGSNHWLQLVNGVENARGTHVLLHDADLFIFDRDLIRRQYETCRDRNLDCLGVSQSWDAWYPRNGLRTAATWELLFRTDWMTGFPPHLHLAHENTLGGNRHVFDTTLYPQSLTPPERIDFTNTTEGMVHFNYVIATYRWFQRSRGPFEDANLRLLLIRLLVDAFDQTGWQYDLPALDDLRHGLSDSRARVTYLDPDTARNYPEFRGKLQTLVESHIVSPQQAELIRNGVRPFDEAFHWPAGTNDRTPARELVRESRGPSAVVAP